MEFRVLAAPTASGAVRRTAVLDAPREDEAPATTRRRIHNAAAGPRGRLGVPATEDPRRAPTTDAPGARP